ncbi:MULTISPECIES: hypothetical protein [unclassified Oceanispirochaeta]|uniref:hypothetical protein n=1 Tax=unclassified Oceanispirochaeta TaxID=2635722 RepID=UPI001E4CC561|nr:MULTISPECIES: hypothetical protein [unclassified Oceanispirochaeta]
MYKDTSISPTHSNPEIPVSEHAGENTADKIYCANCKHCKLIRSSTGNNDQYQLRVRCDAGKWRKKLGEEKFYKYFTVARRSTEDCDLYEPMGDTKAFLKELKKTLPIKDEIYIHS